MEKCGHTTVTRWPPTLLREGHRPQAHHQRRAPLPEAICKAVSELPEFSAQEAARIKALTCRELKEPDAESLILRCYEADILSPRTIHTAIKEWRAPSFEEFQPRTAWSLFNAVTFASGNRAKSNPQAHAALTIKLGGLLSPDAASPQLCTPA